ncbi:MAG: hypothetical protein QOD60_2432, partial [Solirubrobacterales bacterium]|nr:hypothetical protein [Solirubrobacterales bacterium]
GYVSHQTITHESILKLMSYRFGLGYLNMRHRYASNIGQSFDWTNPDFDVPDLPHPSAPIPLGLGPAVTAPCSLGGAPGAAAASGTRTRSGGPGGEGVELNSQAMIDYVERVGFDYKPWKPSDIFSQPDSVVKALQGAN